MIRIRAQFESTLTQAMRGDGYIPVLDIDPAFSVSYNVEDKKWSFVLTIHGIYIGKVKAWQIEGFSSGKMLPRSIPKSKSKKSLSQ
jgi:hypothetical protein